MIFKHNDCYSLVFIIIFFLLIHRLRLKSYPNGIVDVDDSGKFVKTRQILSFYVFFLFFTSN